MRVALATCAEVPGGDDDAPPLIAALSDRAVRAEPAVWDDPAVDWQRFDLVVLRSTWDYAERRDEFLGWVEALPAALNDAGVVRWNTDKRYLAELAGAGVPVVPTTFLDPGDPLPEQAAPFVLKPTVSAGSRQTARYDPAESGRARTHLAALHAEGRAAMVQPYVGQVDDRGESALVYVSGSFSHAVAKAALLRPGQAPGGELFLAETITPLTPTPAEREVAGRALDAVPFARDELLYARVDLLPTAEGPVVLEIELTEPSLFLLQARDATSRLADAIAGVLAAG